MIKFYSLNFFSQSQEMTLNDGGFLNAVRDGSCTYVLNLLDNGGTDLEQQDPVKKFITNYLVALV